MTRRLPVQLQLSGDSPFSYTCNACGRCCRNKSISVNPFEALLIARSQGLSTTEVAERYLDRANQTLLRDEEGDCIFLRERTCAVHDARPAACRVYPLALVELQRGERRFGRVLGHPQSEGVDGAAGTVDGFLEGQGHPMFDAPFDAYRRVFERVTALAESHDGDLDGLFDSSLAWTDVDAALGEQAGVEVAWRRHVALLEAALDRAEASSQAAVEAQLGSNG